MNKCVLVTRVMCRERKLFKNAHFHTRGFYRTFLFKSLSSSIKVNWLYSQKSWKAEDTMIPSFTSHHKFLGHVCRFSSMGSQHELPLDTPILYLKSEEAFAGLTSRERHYAHHLSRASWWGGFIVLCQTSPESPTIFNLLTRLFRSQPIDTLKEVAMLKAGFTEDEFKLLVIYYSGIAYNMGNYLGFGDRKFIPSVSREKLEALIKASKAYLEAPDIIEDYMKKCLEPMYNLEECKKFLGMPTSGVTMYFTPNCTQDDADIAKEYMAARNIEPWNNRLLKHEENGQTLYDIRLASIEQGPAAGITIDSDEFQGHKFRVSRGDYAFFLKKMTEELQLAKDYTANDLEVQMLDKYIESFTTGSIKAHKEGSTFWVKNKSPAVETYMGFIEVYRDPVNQRAEFESFVAVVNREQSRKFDTLVSRAEKEFLPLLPWGKDFEEDVFMRPDFSSLDILTFASSGLPIGINIPNYKDVKEEQGFKNVSLTNVMAARTGIKGGPFLSEADHALIEKHGALGLEIQVGLHELLGHGCGKFLRRKDDGSLNFDSTKIKNPFTGGEAMFYEKGETYNSHFTNLASAYEECRAETVALYLGHVDDILDIFGVAAESREDLKYVSWLDMMYAGLRGLEMYQPSQGKWGQAHSQARYVILRVALEAGQGLVNITETKGNDGLPDLLLTLDKTKIHTVGKQAMGNFLRKLQIYRSMGDSDSGRAMFEKYSEVPSDGPFPFGKWHEIVVRKRRPRMILAMPNTRVVGEDVELVSYPEAVDCVAKSWVDRFSSEDYEALESALSTFV
ncbi:dipeptidyl peptidase 3 isoform X2 [Procambarus clarkii]|uniref:dipeptidyl peptidase 3 isoform X2 n=1 Tax=Procambarus clarkii TaxID=6728 RepID=UPI003742B538